MKTNNVDLVDIYSLYTQEDGVLDDSPCTCATKTRHGRVNNRTLVRSNLSADPLQNLYFLNIPSPNRVLTEIVQFLSQQE